jgi:pantoate--beta-alanine ligase
MFRESGGHMPAENIEAAARGIIEAQPACKVDYATIVNGRTLQQVTTADSDCRLVLAVKVNDKVRLIDNAPLQDSV